MQPKLAGSYESAWEMGDLAYELGDTVEVGIIKAAQAGIKPGWDGYAAFITAFGRRVRSKQLSPRRAANPQRAEPEAAASAVVLTPDFSRSNS